MAMGYDTSELNFYPNKPYLATFYKSKPGKLGTTNTPAKEGRQVIETWNSELFYALCCQMEGDAITPGEFFTDNEGKIHQSTRVDDKWIIVDYPDGKNDAFKKPQCHKSTFEELLARYTGEDVKVKSSVEPTITRASKGIIVDGGSSNKSILAAITEIGSEIINSRKGMSIEQMKEVAELNNLPVPNIDYSALADALELEATIEHHTAITEKTQISLVQDSEIKGDYFLGDGSVNAIFGNPSLTGPMTFKEILNWFGDGKAVVVGVINDSEIKCVSHSIVAVSTYDVSVSNFHSGVPFDQIYKSKEAFLLHALTTLKKQA